MDSAKLNDWLQVIGLFGVIGSLIFVGMQMKQDHDIAVANAYQARSQQIGDVMSQFWTDPAFRSGTYKVENGLEDDITPDELVVLRGMTQSLFQFYENVHFQYQNGFITEDHWAKSRAGMKSFLSIPSRRNTILSTPSTWLASFLALLEELIAEIDAEAAQ